MYEQDTRWRSKTAFIFAAASAAIGLGNIWRFPYLLGEHGGGVFVLLYLAFVIILGMPLLVAEILLGRIGRRNPVTSISNIAKQDGHSKKWGWAGGLTILSGFLIVSYYVVIVGWVLDYIFRAGSGQFIHATQASSLSDFKLLQSSHWQMLLTTSMVVFGGVGINLFGIKKGLERAVMFMFPLMLILLLLLLGYSATTGQFMHAVSFLFKPDLSEVTENTALIALGQAFFSLNIAMGVTMMFSAYISDSTSIVNSSIVIAIADTGFALLAGLIIFPIVFAYHLSPSVGPSLIFQTLPIAFGRMPFGSIIATVFFIMLFFAAFSSVIALLEPAICWMIEVCKIKRRTAVIIVGVACWLLSIWSIVSFSHPQQVTFFGKTFFEIIDFITASIMLPLGGILIAIFCGWFLKKTPLQAMLNWKITGAWFGIWRWCLRLLAPLAILFILLNSLKII